LEYVSCSGSSVAVAYLMHHRSIRITLLDRCRQHQQQLQQLCLSGLSLALLSSFKTTDNSGMPTVSGNRQKTLHGHKGQVRPTLLLPQNRIELNLKRQQQDVAEKPRDAIYYLDMSLCATSHEKLQMKMYILFYNLHLHFLIFTILTLNYDDHHQMLEQGRLCY